jgi:hypothetical protein
LKAVLNFIRLLGRPSLRWEDNIKADLQEVKWGAWTGLIWLMIGQVAGNLCGNETLGLHKLLGILLLAVNRSAAQESLCSVE